MKAEVFAVGFFLVFAGAWFTYAKHTGGLNIKGLPGEEQHIIINSDNFHEEMAYTGKISFTEDETAIARISSGGYLRYTRNEQVLEAKSDTAGVIHYTFKQSGRPMPLDSNAQKIITEAVSEMIAWGFDAKERADRIYKKSGQAGLLDAMEKLKNDGVKRMYAEKLFRTDSLSAPMLIALSKKIASQEGNDYDKEQVLKLYKPAQLQDSAVFYAYLQAVENLGDDNAKANILKPILQMPLSRETFPALFRVVTSIDNDYEKTNMLSSIIEKRQMDTAMADLLLDAIDHLNADNDKEKLLTQWINKGTLPADRLEKLLAIVNKFGSDWEKGDMYKKLAAATVHADEQWVSLIEAIAHINENEEKAGLLTSIAQKMPKTEIVKTAYIKAAKTISTDTEYGKAIRAVD